MNNKIIATLNKLVLKALKHNESPVAAVIVLDNKIIAKAYNKRNKSNKTIDHAEIIAITKANKKIKNWRTNECTMYVTLEPCDMCKTVLKECRMAHAYYFVDRLSNKKQYKKTIFDQINTKNDEEKLFVENYKKIMKNFWENKR